jgi:hypothetical protein
VLTSAKPTDENSIVEPEKVSPKSSVLKISGNPIRHTLPGNSFTVLRIPETKVADSGRSSAAGEK